MIYTGIYDPITKELVAIDGEGVGTIPIDPGNADYRNYLAWLDEGNELVEPGPPPPPPTTAEKVNRLLADYDLTRDELRAAFIATEEASES